MTRTDREDLSAQTAAVEQARTKLAEAIDTLGSEAGTAYRRATSKAKTARAARVDLDPIHAAYLALSRAEEALDLALYDLHTAAGGDG